MAATAVCHSDIHSIRGEIGGTVPFVPGHESSGYVEEIGPGVTQVKPGDACVASLIRSCGTCPNCVSGLTHVCRTRFPMDKEIRMHNKQGQALRRAIYMASFAEYVIVF
ncbi:alcohol dehydrogenase catalytic domain-containing protein [Thermodesulfobacteriota bacterium]